MEYSKFINSILSINQIHESSVKQNNCLRIINKITVMDKVNINTLEEISEIKVFTKN